MRPIKFRAWDTVEKLWRSEDVAVGKHCADLRKDSYATLCVFNGKNNCELMQFTGLYDKNGKEIYEGDIVRNENDKQPNQQIIFVNGMFCLDDEESPLWRYDPKNFWEVIGNVWENPELLNPSA